MKKILEISLGWLAKNILQKYHPKVIGITGSIGKTSAKEAVFAVLNSKFRCRQNIKNYNNELGVPLTIIGAESGGRSLLGWFSVYMQAFHLLWYKVRYPEVLILEMGADKPGDIEYLVKIAPCNVGVVTKVSPTHIEFFGSIENVAKEKMKIVTHLAKDGVAVLNYDDPIVQKMAGKTKARVLFFGKDEEADVSYIEPMNQGAGVDISGLKFKITYRGSAVPMFIPNVVGTHQINAALIAAAVGAAMGMNLIEISDGLRNYKSPKGRMSLIPGMNGSLIIDDTYNSSPDAALAAVDSLAKLNIPEANRRIAVMGDMLELGEMSKSAHENLGKTIAELKYNLLVAVGRYRSSVAKGARQAGLAEIHEFESSAEAGEFLKKNIQPFDLVLVKGSQGSRMEKTVKMIMAEPSKAKELLVRQDKSWVN